MRETSFSLELSMNIHLQSNSIYLYTFVKQRKTDFIIDCLLRDSSINDARIDILGFFTGNGRLTHDEDIKTYYTLIPLYPAKPVQLTPGQEKLFTEGIILRTTVELRVFYSQLKQGRFGSLTEDMFDGVTIGITETTPGHNNTMMVTLNFKTDHVYSFGLCTDYRELDSFSRDFNYRPFTGVQFQVKQGLHFCFIGTGGGIGVGIYHDARPIDYSLAVALQNGFHIQYENSLFQRWVRDSIINLETERILANIYHNTDDEGKDFLQYFDSDKRSSQEKLAEMLPARYTINEKANTIFDRNLENFAKEYGSIAAAALQRVRAKEK